MRTRCEGCGYWASTNHACKRCNSDLHLEHCHCWMPLEKLHWKTCPKRHAHPGNIAGHTHDDKAVKA